MAATKNFLNIPEKLTLIAVFPIVLAMKNGYILPQSAGNETTVIEGLEC